MFFFETAREIRARYVILGVFFVLPTAIPAHGGEGPEFVDQTAERLIAAPEVGIDDQEEKDYAWGDVDNDGDTDLVVVRKQPFSGTGRRRNVLFMNESGVLVDRTVEYATAADDGGQGFLDPTNDRDVVLIDVNGDGWLDIVTAATLGDGLPKTISHPRVYINLGEDDGEWLGYRYEESRIPQLHETAGPWFNAVAAGDVTGDGFPDLYFVESEWDGQEQSYDFNDRLLINDGAGFFMDESTLRMTEEMLSSLSTMATAIRDMNDDGAPDVVKAGLPPEWITIAYNDPGNIGVFSVLITVVQGAPTYVSVGDLNQDQRPDLVVTDDGMDRYLLNMGNGPDGYADFIAFTFPNSLGFGGNSVIADLDGDGWQDVIITDVDFIIPGCTRTTRIYRSSGGDPPSFIEVDVGIPEAALEGWHDAAVFDIDGDGYLDIVAGRCSGTQIWMNVPQFNIGFDYPNGLPEFVQPNEEHVIQVQLSAVGASVDPATVTMYYSVNGDAFVEVSMTSLGEDLYEAALPAVDCLDRINFYFEAQLENGFTLRDPTGAPVTTYATVAALGTALFFSDDMEGDVSAWTVESDPSLQSGEWEPAEPNGTIHNGDLVAPDHDATPGVGNVMAFVTENCKGDECSDPGATDVDGGPTYLISPTMDLSGLDATVRYARWFYTSSSGGEDLLTTEVSNDGGGNWVLVHATEGTGSSWETAEFRVNDYVTPTATVRVRFSTEDVLPGGFVEAGIDDFEVERLVCEFADCDEDLDGDGTVGASDLAQLLGAWGPNPGHPADFDGDGTVGPADLAVLLGSWGPCEL